MAKNRSQASAFDLMADFSDSPAPSLPGGPVAGGVAKDTPPQGVDAGRKVALKKPRAEAKRPPVDKTPQKARNGSIPCERSLKACNILLFGDQVRPLALLEIDMGENRSELVRRLVDAELKKMGYADNRPS